MVLYIAIVVGDIRIFKKLKYNKKMKIQLLQKKWKMCFS